MNDLSWDSAAKVAGQIITGLELKPQVMSKSDALYTVDGLDLGADIGTNRTSIGRIAAELRAQLQPRTKFALKGKLSFD